MGPTVSLPRKNIESPAASGFHLPKKYLRPRLPISTADGFSLAPRFYISLKTGGGGDHGRISLLRSWQCTDDVVRLVLAHLHERLESTDVVRLVLARRRSDMASEEALDEARTEWRRGGIGSGTSPARRSSTEEAWLGQLLVLGVARTRCLADGAVARSSHGCSARVREREEREHRGKGGRVRPIGFCGSVYGNRWTVTLHAYFPITEVCRARTVARALQPPSPRNTGPPSSYLIVTNTFDLQRCHGNNHLCISGCTYSE
jgi:hypothetical protein